MICKNTTLNIFDPLEVPIISWKYRIISITIITSKEEPASKKKFLPEPEISDPSPIRFVSLMIKERLSERNSKDTQDPAVSRSGCPVDNLMLFASEKKNQNQKVPPTPNATKKKEDRLAHKNGSSTCVVCSNGSFFINQQDKLEEVQPPKKPKM